MKSNTIIFILIFLNFIACEDALEEVPKDFLSPVNYYQTKEDAEGAILGVYQANLGGDFIIGETYTGYFNVKGSWTAMGNLDQPLDATQYGRANGIWNRGYNIINRANVVLNRVPAIDMDEGEKKQILAEAYFLRAWAYLDLVRSYGPVPLRLMETTDLNHLGAPRAPVSDVYDQIVSDLKVAETDLPEDIGANTGRASKWAAKIILANAYLDIEDWTNAAMEADEVINSNKYALVTVNEEADFYKIFATETSTEDVFSNHYSPNQANFTTAIRWMHITGTPVYCVGEGYNVIYANVNSSLLNDWDPNDLRSKFNLYTGFYRDGVWVENPPTTPLLFKKYIMDPQGLATHSRPLIRYAEPFLIYAEAAAKAQGNPTPLALERLNSIRRRAYGHDPNTVSPDDFPEGMTEQAFLDTVMRERAYEFMLENKRFWDLKRTNTFKQTILAEKGINVIDARILHPLPQEEISNNPDIGPGDQNPGY